MSDPRRISTRDNLRIFGAAEGSLYNVPKGRADLRYVATFAADGALSFGIAQLDGSGNPVSHAVFRQIMDRAVARGDIGRNQANEIVALARLSGARGKLGEQRINQINTIFSRDYARQLIDAGDLARVNSLGWQIETAMNDAFAYWQARGQTPGWRMYNERLTMYSYILATVNRADSTLAYFSEFLRGERTTAGRRGRAFDLNAPPTPQQVIEFARAFAMWKDNPVGWGHLRDRLDPTIDRIQTEVTGTHIGYFDDLPAGVVLANFGADLEKDGQDGLFSFTQLSEDGTGIKFSLFGPDVAGAVATLSVIHDESGNLASVVYFDGQTSHMLDMADLVSSNTQLRSLLEALMSKLQFNGVEEALEDFKVGGGPSIEESFLAAQIDANGNLILTGYSVRTLTFDPRTGTGRYAIAAGVDEFGRQVEQDWQYNAFNGAFDDTGVRRLRDGALEIVSQPGQPTTIRLLDSPIGLDFVDAAGTITSVLGRYLIGGNALVQTVTSAALNTLGSNLGDILNTLAFDSGVATVKNMGDALDGMDAEFLANLKSAGVGALSSYLTAELVRLAGVQGFEGEALNGIAGSAVNQIASNLAEIALGTPNVGVFDGVTNLSQIGNTAGAFLGNHLASKVGSWDEIGEQLGSSVGGTLGSIAGQALIPVPVLGAIVGSFLGNLLGGLVGGVFTGTPKSGAILGWNADTGMFEVTQLWKEDGGQKKAAEELGKSAAEALNGIVSFIDGELVNGPVVDGGSYGLRGKRFVYWEDGTSSENRIKFKEAEDLVEHGVLEAARQFQFLGGDIYAKRAFYNTLSTAGLIGTSAETGGTPELTPGQLYDGSPLTSVEFGLDTLLGNLAVVERLHTYLDSRATVHALIAAEPNSGLAADWMLAFARMDELGLWKRSVHDWAGGFSYLLTKAGTSAHDVSFAFDLLGDGYNGERIIGLGEWVLQDTVDTGSKTVVLGTDGDDRLVQTSVPQRHIASVFHGGDGDDEIRAAGTGDDLFGGAGDDLLVGGALDDWLFGGTGNDVLDAGGGNGNLLSGGDGDDILVGADRAANQPDGGSDWLSGGGGDDVIAGRGGDDFIDGGEGSDRIDGGRGSDTIIYRSLDGDDLVADSGTDPVERDTLDLGGISEEQLVVVAPSSGERLSILVGDVTGSDRIDLAGIAYAERAGIDEFILGEGKWGRGDLTARAVFSKSAGMELTGTADDDSVTGSIHDDELGGGTGSDILEGGFGSDVYHFAIGDGADTIVERGFDADLDTLMFGAGIAPADLAVTYSTVSPADLTITIGSSGDKVVLRDQLSPDGRNSIEQVLFADGTTWTIRDLIARVPAASSTTGADIMSGTHAGDVLSPGAGDDTITGGLGNDNIDGGTGSDTYHYAPGDGHDRIKDGNRTDTLNRLVLGAGINRDDVLLRRDAADSSNLILEFREAPGSILLDNQLTYSTLSSWIWDLGVGRIEFADGTYWGRSQIISRLLEQGSTALSDYTLGTRFNDTISGQDGDDFVSAQEGNDVITGGRGNDNLKGDAGSDTYHYAIGDGSDRIFDGYNGDVNKLVFGAGITAADLVLRWDQADRNNLLITFTNAPGSVLLDNQLTYDTLSSWAWDQGVSSIEFADGTSLSRSSIIGMLIAQNTGSNADLVTGTWFVDVVATGAGNDVVRTEEGDDVITGGSGNDNLSGGTGSDIYHYAIGDGEDRISDGYRGDSNRLVFGAGITAADLLLERDQADASNLIVSFRDSPGAVILDNQLTYDTLSSWLWDLGVDAIQFADGSSIDRLGIISLLLAQGSTAAADNIVGTRFADTIAAGAGNDIISGAAGNDILAGGAGNDSLNGGDGADIYHYSPGDGHDRIADVTLGQINRLYLGAGVTAADVMVERDQADANNVRLTFGSQSGSILLDDLQNYDLHLTFADGTTWDTAAIRSAAVSATTAVNGTSAADTLTGTSARENLYGSGGNDVIAGGAGSDLLRGGTGDDIYLYNPGDGFDVIVEESGIDTVRFGAGIATGDLVLSRPAADGDTTGIVIAIGTGNDRLLVKNATGVERYEFSDGTVWTEADLRTRLFEQLQTSGADLIHGSTFGESISGGGGADRLYGNGGNDTLAGGAGSDLLDGGTGDDTYLFCVGDGRDVLSDASGIDTVRFGAGIAAADLVISRPLADGDTSGLVIAIAGTQDRLYVKNATLIERYEFSDGTVWTEAQLRARFLEQARTEGADVIHGSALSDTIAGDAGADEIYGQDGNDVLEGNAGNDLLDGGAGNDLFIFRPGDGYDVIVDGGGTDTVRFGDGITRDMLRLARPMADGDTTGLIISIDGSADQLYVKAATGIERYEFADGSALTEAQMRAMLFAQTRTAGADIVRGSSLADSLDGGAGADRLHGEDGNDTLIGGRGPDLMLGGDGNDSYLVNIGDGQDTIEDSGGTDTVRFGPGVMPEDITVSRPMADGDTTGVIIERRGGEDRLYIKNATSLETYAFADGRIWTAATVTALLQNTVIGGKAQPVSMGADVIFGSAGADTLWAMGGDDILRGGTGSDTYRFALGDGYDTIHEPVSDADTDTLVLTSISSTMVRVVTSATDPDDVVLLVDDLNQIHLDQQKAGASGGIDLVQFSDGVSWSRADLLARAGNTATAGADTLVGTSFGETLSGGAGNDLLVGRAGGDTYVYGPGDGDDIIQEEQGPAGATDPAPSAADDTILLGAGIAVGDLRLAHVQGSPGDLLLTFASAAGSILLKGQNNGAGAGIERLQFSDGTTMSVKALYAQSLAAAATASADRLVGFHGNDELAGGAGNDVLEGGAGADRYMFSVGDGTDVIVENGRPGESDEISFGAGISAETVLLRRRADAPDDLILILPGGAGELRLAGQLSGRAGDGIELVRFDDGTIWTAAQLIERYRSAPATPESDFIAGTDAGETLDGLEGDDLIDGGRGDDSIHGGGGDDRIAGGAGNDSLAGGAGDDSLSGGTGTDSFDGGAGYDTVDYSFSRDSWVVNLSTGAASLIVGGATLIGETLVGIEAVIGGAGADTLTGDAGDNRLEGREADDILRGGDGDDLFIYRGSENGSDQVDGGPGLDRIEAGEAGTVIGLSVLAGVEEISGSGHSGVILAGTDLADSLDFSGVQLSDISLIYTAAGNDVVTTSAGSDTIDLGLGDDVLRFGGGLADSIAGGDGNDRIEAMAADTIIRLSALGGVEQVTANGFSNVVIAGTDAGESLNFATVTLTGIVRIEGGGGNDTLTGSAGNDTIRGGAGDDILSGGAGDDMFEVSSAADGADRIDGGTGIDRLVALSNAVPILLAAAPVGIEFITGMSSALVFGAGADSINLSAVTLAGIASIDAGAGNDTLIASAADDTILAGLGNDTLTGNGGNDTYRFGLGDGQDVIAEYANTGGGSGGTDALVLGAGINPDDVRVTKQNSGLDILLTIAGSTDTVTIRNQGSTTTSHWVEEVRFADGSVWTRAMLLANAMNGTAAGDTLTGTASADFIRGFDGADTVTGAAGNDTLHGGSGDDLLNGGTGDDVLSGGAGNDTFQYGAAGDGYDHVAGGDGFDTIVATAANTWIGLRSLAGVESISSGGYSGVTVWGSTSSDQLDFSPATLTGITKIDGYDGNDVIIGSGGIDSIVGGNGDDRISGGSGNDTLNGGAGTDTVDYSSSVSPWTVDLGAATNQARSGTEIDTLTAIENVIGSSAGDTLIGNTGANVLSGLGGNDRITGGAGNDSIDGGPGTDIATFAGDQASYSLVTSGGSIQVVDLQPTLDGNDGTDVIAAIETLEFKAGVQVSLAAPIVLDLDGDGVSLVESTRSGARFDWNGDGELDITGWVGRGDGILVYDRDRNGTASGREELTFVNDKPGAKSDLDGLTAFDGDGDGLLSEADESFSHFKVWVDRNGNASVESGEVLTMEEAGIRSLSLEGRPTEQSWSWGANIVANEGQFTRNDGSVAALADVALHYRSGAGRTDAHEAPVLHGGGDWYRNRRPGLPEPGMARREWFDADQEHALCGLSWRDERCVDGSHGDAGAFAPLAAQLVEASAAFAPRPAGTTFLRMPARDPRDHSLAPRRHLL